MALHSGKTGTVTWNSGTVSHVTSWQCTETVNSSAWGSSNTAGYKHRVAGTKDWSGTFAAKYDSSIAPVVGEGTRAEGATPVSLVLTLATNETLTGNAMIESVALDVNVDTGDVIGYTCTFGGNGPLTRT